MENEELSPEDAAFSASVEAALAESEKEEREYQARQNGEVTEETTSEEPSELEKLKARIAELEAGQKTDEEKKPEEGDKTDEEQKTDEVESQFTEQDYETAKPWYEAIARGEPTPQAAYDFAKERFGITDKSMVDAYMTGAMAKQSAATSEFATAVRSSSGEVNYDSLMAWAADNLSEAEINEYDSTLETKNVAAAKAATQALMFRMKAEGGVVPKIPQGRIPSAAPDVYADMNEIVKATLDPRYDTDSTYRKQVEAKIERTHKASAVSVTKGSRAY